MNGYWMNLTLSMNNTPSAQNATFFQYFLNITCFVAINQPKINGLQGTLGLAVSTGDVASTFSALNYLNVYYDIPIDYVSIYSR